MADPPVKTGDILAGKYRVERILGSGGMGVVVAAWHEELEQRVAVKFLLPEIAERSDAAERFRREARAAVKIRSEHVARILDVGTMDGIAPYMVMEYLDGQDLSEELRIRSRLPVDESLDYLLQATEAIAEAHAAGIVHRDLKPANLFLSLRSDGSRVVKVLDFGISKTVIGGSVNDMSLTRTASLIGSPLYMSPEQMKSARDVDSRTDIWALGAILFEMLAGRPPYIAETIPQLCAVLLHDAPPPLSEFRTDVPAGLEAVIVRCLAKDRAHRWQNVAELAQNLAVFAPASMKFHAERVRRVLGSTEISIGQPRAPSLQGHSGQVPTQIGVAPGTSTAASSLPGVQPGSHSGASDAGAADAPKTSSTLASWGRTGEAQEARHKARRRLVIGGAIAALALGAVGVGLALRTRAPERVPAQAAALAEAQPGANDPALQRSSASPTAHAEPSAEPKAIAVVAVPGSATPAAGAPLSSATPSRAPAQSFPGRTARKRPDWIKTAPQGAQNKSVPSSITDFGGRR